MATWDENKHNTLKHMLYIDFSTIWTVRPRVRKEFSEFSACLCPIGHLHHPSYCYVGVIHLVFLFSGSDEEEPVQWVLLSLYAANHPPTPSPCFPSRPPQWSMRDVWFLGRGRHFGSWALSFLAWTPLMRFPLVFTQKALQSQLQPCANKHGPVFTSALHPDQSRTHAQKQD